MLAFVTTISGCAFVGSDEQAAPTAGRLDVEKLPSERATADIPAERLAAYRQAGDELGLDWTVIAAVSDIETDHGRAGAGPASIEDALAIGYALKSTGAPGDYRAALTTRGGRSFASRALSLSEGFGGGAPESADVEPENGPLDPPVNGEVRAGFGTLYGRPHLGIDFDARTETEVRAAASGVVSDVGSAPAYGRYACILHRFPKGLRTLENLTTCYGYLGSTDLRPGEKVDRGEMVGLSGCSGACLSPRVHFIVRRGATPDSIPTDPAPFLSRD